MMPVVLLQKIAKDAKYLEAINTYFDLVLCCLCVLLFNKGVKKSAA